MLRTNAFICKIEPNDYSEISKLYCDSCKIILKTQNFKKCNCLTKNCDGQIFSLLLYLKTSRSSNNSLPVILIGEEAEFFLNHKAKDLKQEKEALKEIEEYLSLLLSTRTRKIQIDLVTYISSSGYLRYQGANISFINI